MITSRDIRPLTDVRPVVWYRMKTHSGQVVSLCRTELILPEQPDQDMAQKMSGTCQTMGRRGSDDRGGSVVGKG
ncbi:MULTISPECIES: hypothetical protein [Gluconobacter]|uniref:Uncharacterized protein n=2 Tax=Acetobacteraceae TaxID=433 RepID=A0AAV5NFL2_9PROT|nr:MULTISPECIES: hypothetical protein [Gluconobacter]MBM3098263.1 hypothetical protein [Gluconobacter cerinus]MBS0993826.1 hypothetical protein [Gluconobacter cerinus]MBS1017777.1 hypothetical protein [Gluconobacter cerinus]MBS1020934.1 hypothetical protein [Gluconobacter cerinus]MBS1024370.1 hypothetical protein [Gluconobacter cerinus]